MGTCYSSIGKGGKENGEGDQVDVTETSINGSPRKTKWRKKSRDRKSSGDHQESSLHRIQGRMVMSGCSKIACLHTQQGKKGTNQDAMIVWENFGSRNDAVFCGVFDGHGPSGHMVARRVRDSLPTLLNNQWQVGANGEHSSLDKNGNSLGSMDSEENSSVCGDDESYDSMEVEESDKVPEMYVPLKRSMLKAFKLMDKELKLHPTIDCFCSGTTAVTLIKLVHDATSVSYPDVPLPETIVTCLLIRPPIILTGNVVPDVLMKPGKIIGFQDEDLIIGNVGDSRAVLATRDDENSLLAVQLTVDLKPDLPREAARIQQCKGRVFALQDEPEVARVWLPNSDSPGLAMARAFGDFCLKDFGLISVPDLYYRRLTSKDEFIILASDGVWDVLSNKEAVDIVASAPSRATAARALIDCAVRAWRLKYPTSKNDDCAVVCLFLDHSLAENGTGEVPETKGTPNDQPGEKVDTEMHTNSDDHVLTHSGTTRSCDEIVPVSESTEAKANATSQSRSQSKRSLAECISSREEDEWSALEGITRVNSLLSIPRFLSGDRKSSGSRRKWL
ncbi:Probable protein phosphatase 2C 18 [Linum grandiflorum]